MKLALPLSGVKGLTGSILLNTVKKAKKDGTVKPVDHACFEINGEVFNRKLNKNKVRLNNCDYNICNSLIVCDGREKC